MFNIEKYDTKILPYHFVLFYDIPLQKLAIFKLMYHGEADDNALLTYCYMDGQYGLSYKVICWATIHDDGKVTYHKERDIKIGATFRHGSINCQANTYDEAMFPSFRKFAEEIKENYGYMKSRKDLSEESLFEDFRDPQNIENVLAVFMTQHHNVERIWVSEQSWVPTGGFMAKVLEEPCDSEIGIHEGELVHIVPKDFAGRDLGPIAVLEWMKN
ncbi:hypothetical protein [Butyrivibrio sp. VCD2006]|uniref:hypothetical protein n=1 Tax=Butyrivibrio sp. VCD2006 TaxID=1280664 RepID=UPI0004218DC3|nr:hypothetical protein [Butyrivibrio sp. VCD2006]